MGVKQILVRILGSVLPKPEDPHLDFVEIFAGERAVSKGMTLLGYSGMSMDLRLDHRHDIMTPIGLVLLIVSIARLRPGGIFWAAPPCSTWVFLSRHSTGRDKVITGNPMSEYVEAQNALVCRLLLVCRLCIARGVYFIIEQPTSTCMWEYPNFVDFLNKHPEINRVKLQMGAYGLLAQKDTMLLGTAPYLEALHRRMVQSEIQHVANEAMQTTVSYIDGGGAKRCHGGKDLKQTQAYPLGFGAAHALAYQAHAAAAAGLEPADLMAAARRNLPASPVAAIDCSTISPQLDTAAAVSNASASKPAAAGDAASTNPWADILKDISDSEEDDWYLQDVKIWKSRTWYNNYAGEQKLALPDAPPTVQLPNAKKHPKQKPAKHKAEMLQHTKNSKKLHKAMQAVEAALQSQRLSLQILQSSVGDSAAAEAPADSAAVETPLDKAIYKDLQNIMQDLKTADANLEDSAAAELTSLWARHASLIKCANARYKVPTKKQRCPPRKRARPPSSSSSSSSSST
jgi:hypothetical protein